MPVTGHSEMKKVVRELKARGGWDIGRSNGGHLKLTYEDGSIIFAASSPSDSRSIKNTWAEIERIERRAADREREPDQERDEEEDSPDDYEQSLVCDDCGEGPWDDAFALSEHVRQEHTPEESGKGHKDMSNIEKVRQFLKEKELATTQEVVDATGLTGGQVTTAWYNLKKEPGFFNQSPGEYAYSPEVENGEIELSSDGGGETEGNGRRGRSRVILNFMHKHPGRAFTVEELAEELFPKEYAEDSSGTSGRCSTAAARMARADGYRIERVGRGVYRYVPAGDGEASEEEVEAEQERNERAHAATEKVVSRIQFAPAQEDATLFEAVRELRDGKLLLESEGGRLYVARELDLEV